MKGKLWLMVDSDYTPKAHEQDSNRKQSSLYNIKMLAIHWCFFWYMKNKSSLIKQKFPFC